MLSGHRPPNASDIFNEGFECVDFSAPAFTPQVIEVIQRAMSPKKKARYQTAKEFLSALRAIDCEETIIELIKPNTQSEVIINQPRKLTNKNRPPENGPTDLGGAMTSFWIIVIVLMIIFVLIIWFSKPGDFI